MSDRQQGLGQPFPDMAKLRKRAEEKAGDMEPASLSMQTPEAIQQMVHELRVHQIELTMQNEELRRAHAEIEASQGRYFDLYDLAPVGYITVSEKGLILETNLTAVTLMGVPRSALVKQPISRFILKEDQDIYYRHRENLFETGEPQICEMRMVKPDGNVFWAHLTATLAEGPEGVPVCRVVLDDITERKQADAEKEKLQEELNQSRKMESVGRLAGGVAHDFNNMLGVILGHTELALLKTDENHDLYFELKEIQTAARRSADITKQLLAFARKEIISPRPLDLNKGYSVLPAATPAEAVENAKNHSGAIDLLVTDVVMPEMNGRDLARQITAIYPDIGLLFMSGYTSNVIAHQGLLDDGVAFIQKPFSTADLTEKVREVLDTVSDKDQG